MNESRTAALSLWSRLISGESLDEVQRQQLAELLQQESTLQEEIAADSNLNALLRFITEVRQTDEQFVQDVLARCSSASPRTPPKIELDQTEMQTAGQTGRLAPFNDDREVDPLHGVWITVATIHRSTHARAYSRRPKRSKWTVFTTIAAVSVCLGLALWALLDAPNDIAHTTPTNGVIQGHNTATANDQKSTQPNISHSIASANQNPDRKDESIDPTIIRPKVEDPIQALPKPLEGFAEYPAIDSLAQFVTLTRLSDPVWERKSVVGDRLGNEIVRLFAGSIELTFDEGAVVTVDGPIEFRPLSTGQLELRRGRLLASIPQQAIGFTVSTPTSKIVDLGTEFEVAVNDTGESNVQVLKGEVEVSPITLNENDVQKWRLLPDDFHRASFFALPQIQGPVPLSASFQGREGQFQGFVSLNGKTAEFSNQEAFDNVRRHAVTELVRSQENALRQWEEFVDSMQNNMRGTMKLNGQEMEFGSMQDVMQLQSRMFNTLKNAGNNANNSTFSGSININGKVMTFKTPKEYEAARRAAFGPAATFGIGDVFGVDPEER